MSNSSCALALSFSYKYFEFPHKVACESYFHSGMRHWFRLVSELAMDGFNHVRGINYFANGLSVFKE
jgi:hypothetical protein